MTDPIAVRRSELLDKPGYTGITLRNEGWIGIYINGRGFVGGPMTPHQLRGLAEHALAVADLLDRRGEDAAQDAAAELARIVGEGTDDA